MTTRYRVTYLSIDTPLSSEWNDAEAAIQAARRVQRQGYRDVRIWKRDEPPWEPMKQSEFPGDGLAVAA